MRIESTTQTFARKRRKMTIEEALRWAIRDELPKRREDRPIRGPLPTVVNPMWRMGVFGGPIDNWHRDPGFPLAMGDPHPDALVIEGQLKGLCETLRLASTNDALCPLDLSPYPIDTRLAGRAELNTLIATALHATPTWLQTCAINGTRPDVGYGPVCEPQYSDNGKITLWRTVRTPCGTGSGGEPLFSVQDEVATTKGDARDSGLFCKLAWTRTGEEVVAEQIRYAFWHAALAYLVPGLQFLTSIQVLAPAAGPTPWIERPAEPAAPLPNLRPLRRVDLRDRRPAGRRDVRRRASEVRQIDPRTWVPPGERTA